MSASWLFTILLALPAAGAAASLLLPTRRAVLWTVGAGVAVHAVVAVSAARCVLAAGPVFSPGEWFFIDALSAWHLLVMMIVFVLTSFYAMIYFRGELESGALSLRLARRFGALWFGALGAMTLVMISNNLGILWVGIEATTLLTAFLICLHRSPASLEAMWKYLIICSVGVAFAFMGTLFVAASAGRSLSPANALLWTRLFDAAPGLDRVMLEVGFIFLLVGYGTKAGLAPMHTWLPDAHSQAPSPVSALFSGFLLSSALYCVLRYVPLVERATGYSGWAPRLLVILGLISILIAAAFIIFQRDVKRFLAYSSVEHIGIITLGFGLGGLGAFAALFHTLNHSLAKTLAFFSAGRLGQVYGTHDMSRISGALKAAPVWGVGLFGSLLALIGVAPFAIFMSEFQTAKAAVDDGAYVPLALFLLGCGVVFIGALRHVVVMVWGEPSPETRPEGACGCEWLLMLVPLALLLVLGVWMPRGMFDALSQAAAIVGGQP